MAEWLALPTSDHGVAGSNPAGGKILPKLKRRFIAQSLSCSPFHGLEMTEILLKGCKTLTHPILLNELYIIPEISFSKVRNNTLKQTVVSFILWHKVKNILKGEVPNLPTHGFSSNFACLMPLT